MDKNQNGVWQFLTKIGAKEGINEIIINTPDTIFIERNSELIRLDLKLKEEDILAFCLDIAKENHVDFNKDNQIIDGSLKDGSRINIIGPVYTGKHSAITIRKFTQSKLKFSTSPQMFDLGQKGIDFLTSLVKSGQNIIISGGTSSGKTTLLNLLLQEIPLNERVVTIEDTRELYTPISNSIHLMAKAATENVKKPLTTRDLVKNTLRMRPDRIIIGEVRGAEAFDLIQAMNTGHKGCMCSIHANTPVDALARLENLFYFAGHDIPLKAIRKQISRSVDFIVQVTKNREGRRVISKITEITDMENDTILTQDIAGQLEGKFKFTGLVPKRIQQLNDYELNPAFFVNT